MKKTEQIKKEYKMKKWLPDSEILKIITLINKTFTDEIKKDILDVYEETGISLAFADYRASFKCLWFKCIAEIKENKGTYFNSRWLEKQDDPFGLGDILREYIYHNYEESRIKMKRVGDRIDDLQRDVYCIFKDNLIGSKYSEGIEWMDLTNYIVFGKNDPNSLYELLGKNSVDPEFIKITDDIFDKVKEMDKWLIENRMTLDQFKELYIRLPGMTENIKHAHTIHTMGWK